VHPMMAIRAYLLGLSLVLVLFGATAPARASESGDDALLAEFEAEFEENLSFPDPWEPLNRVTFAVNDGVDQWVMSPLVSVYVFVVPQVARHGVYNFLFNLKSPSVLANDLLQMAWKDAGITAARFATNSIWGIAGFFDPAAELGMKRHDSDFAQTLALYGVPSGPFLVLPLLGPSTMRGTVGLVTDMFFRPTTYLIGPIDQLFYYALHGGSVGLANREVQDQAVRALRKSSVDYYAGLRNAYYQHRLGFIYRRSGGRAASETAGEELAASTSDPADTSADLVASR
jgi:phospholipid-binding lipoprotein MlaA